MGMVPPPFLSKPMWTLVAAYFLASLAHFTHNAEYIAFYPGLPASLTPGKVYLAWLGVTSVGVGALALFKFGLPVPAFLLLGVYGALGLDGLAHYTLALCSEHTFVTNVTIGSEAAIGLALLLASSLTIGRRLSPVARERAA